MAGSTSGWLSSSARILKMVNPFVSLASTSTQGPNPSSRTTRHAHEPCTIHGALCATRFAPTLTLPTHTAVAVPREQNPSAETVNEMIQAARDAGLSIYMDAWPGVYNVTQTGCAYDEAAEEGASRQGHLWG